MTGETTGFAVLYRFRVRPGMEAAFADAWTGLTELIRDHKGGRGSRLHRGDDGLFYAYAQWPDRATWEADGSLPPEAEPLGAAMRDATLERLPAIELVPVADLLLPED